MSLLSTFAILFETDAKDAAKDVEGLSDGLDDVTASANPAAKGVDNVTTAVNTSADSIGGLTSMMFKLGAAYVSFDAIASGILDNALGIDTVGKFSQTLGLNIVEVDAWGEAVARNGGNAESFKGVVESLSSSLSSISIDGGDESIVTLSRLGITATKAGGEIKSAFEVLPELADSFANLSTQESAEFGKKLGLDQGTILLLQQGRTDVDKLVERQKMLGGVTQEGYEAAALFNDQWDDSKRVFNSLWMSANSTLLPALTSILGALETTVLWVKENQTLVEGFFIGVAAVVTAVYLPAIASAAAATLVAAAPFIAIGLAIASVGAAFAILYEDLLAWKNGSSSLLGDMLGDFNDFKQGVFDVIDSIANKWSAFIGWFSKAGASISGAFDDVFGGDGEVNATQRNTNMAMTTTNAYGANPLNNGGSSSSQSNQTISIQVGGATIDARGMSQGQAKAAFSSGLEDSVRLAIGQINDGVDR